VFCALDLDDHRVSCDEVDSISANLVALVLRRNHDLANVGQSMPIEFDGQSRFIDVLGQAGPQVAMHLYCARDDAVGQFPVESLLL
jgi:hypothetical protein